MSTGESKIPLSTAQNVADRFIKYLTPYVKVISVAGSIRREVEYVGDIDVVCIASDEFSMTRAFPEGFKGLVMNGSRLKRFKYPESGIQIELHITNQNDYGRILAIATGSSAYSHGLAMQWNRRGWAGTSDGLRRKTECDHKGSTWKIKPEYKNCPTLPPIFATEESFLAFIGIDFVHPKARSWVSNKPEYNYSK